MSRGAARKVADRALAVAALNALARPVLALAVSTLTGIVGCDQPPSAEPDERASVELGEALGGDADPAGFSPVLGPRELDFPKDHGPHPDHRIEWWYVTGNLESTSGERFGYQFTLFRSALRATPRESSSAWAADQLYMAHFAVTEIDRGEFHTFERFARGAAGLAGVTVEPFTAWLEGWSLISIEESFLPLRLRAEQAGVEIEIEIARGKPLVLQGDRGYSRKSADGAAASHYYSYTRLPTTGRIRTPAGERTVRGESWLDREWTTSLLDPQHVGWDWFSLQFEDEHELMYFQLRRRDGSIEPTTSGTWVRPDGSTRKLGHGDVALRVDESWPSASGREYPVRWRLTCAALELDVEVEAAAPNQEHDHSIAYWEGAVTASGERSGNPLSGRGYAELTGYSAPD